MQRLRSASQERKGRRLGGNVESEQVREGRKEEKGGFIEKGKLPSQECWSLISWTREAWSPDIIGKASPTHKAWDGHKGVGPTPLWLPQNPNSSNCPAQGHQDDAVAMEAKRIGTTTKTMSWVP